ncbi:Helicase associated domain protein, partial [Planktomarina temperata]|nr:Helicase associated domain protein [Planktomarina temperata]
RVISFHSRVAGAKQFSDELVDVANLIEPANRPEGTFLSDYVSGDMKAGDRKEKIDRLKELEGYDRGILTNARCLAEGVDVTSLDGVAFIDPRGSQVEIIQAVGRAIRKVRGATVQKKGTIVLPVFIENGDDHETAIEASNFKPVWDVLKALRAHDELLADTLDRYRTDMAKDDSQNRESISDKIIFDLPVSVDAEFSSALRTVLVEASTASWEFWFGLLESFNEREGHCLVPKGFKLDCFQLGNWVNAQRQAKDTIPRTRKQRLDDIDFVWDPHAEAWEEGFTKLLQFKEAEGHCRVPFGFKLGGFNLGNWVSTQRRAKDSASTERRQRLDEIGFVWDPLVEAWEQGFDKLIEFKEAGGHCRVPISFKQDGFKLGVWVRTQRDQNEMSYESKKRLDDIGFIWDPYAEAWEEGFSKLLQFKKAEGHVNVPQRYNLDGFKLGAWVSNLRNSRSTLSIERKQQLDEIGFLWDVLTEAWEGGFRELLQFWNAEGHCKVPQGFKLNGFKLGLWVRTQRKAQNDMSSERKQRLDDIGFIWDTYAKAWEEGFSKLLQFKEAEGHVNVPQRYNLDAFKLGQWVGTQRRHKDDMSYESRQRLDDMGFIWGAPKGKT